MINDFLDNLAANQYQKMHNKPRELREVVGDKVNDIVEKKLLTDDVDPTHT